MSLLSRTITYEQTYAYRDTGPDPLQRILTEFDQTAECQWLKSLGYSAQHLNTYSIQDDLFTLKITFELPEQEMLMFLLTFPQAELELDLEAV